MKANWISESAKALSIDIFSEESEQTVDLFNRPANSRISVVIAFKKFLL